MTVTWLGVALHEFDVAATDFLLFVEALVMAALLRRRGTSQLRLRTLAVALFVLLGTSSLLGALFHAFFPGKATTAGGQLVWMLTGVSIAMTTTVVWLLDAVLARSTVLERWLPPLAAAYFAGFLAVLFFVSYAFATIIALYAPAVVVLAILAVRNWLATRGADWRNLVTGTALSFAAAGVQVAKIDLHPAWFNFNALYHLVQGVALLFLYRAFRQMQLEQPSG